MRLIKKFVLVSGISLCFIVIILSGMGLYLYYHPERIKPIIERSISATTGSSCTIESISYSLQPMVLEARGIFLKTLRPQQAFSMKIPFIRADMAVEGPWGHRSLVIENIQMNGIFMNFTLPFITPGEKVSSFPARMVQGFVSLFFFRDIRFQSGEILDGHILVSGGDQTIQIHKIHAEAGTDKPFFFSFAMEVKNSSRNMHVTAPNVNLVSGSAFGIYDLAFSGTLQAEDVKLQDAELGIQRMDVQAKFTYSHVHKNLHVENLQVRSEGIALTPDSEKTGSSTVSGSTAESISMQTALTYDMGRGEIAFAPLKLDINGLALMGKSAGRLPLMDVMLKAEGISSRYPVIEITNVTLQVPQAKIHTGTRDILIGDVRIYIPDGRIDTEKRSIALPKVRFDTFGLKNMLLAIGLKNGRINMMLQGENTALLQSAAAYQLLPSDWDLSTRDSIRIEAAGTMTGPWQVRAKLSLDELACKNKDGSLMGENISLTTETEGVVDLTHSSMIFAVALEAKAGEALYDRYYLNLAKNPIVTSCNGTYQFQQRFLQLSRLRFDLTDILPLEIQGFLKQDPSMRSADFTVNIPQVSVKPIFHHLLQEPYKTEKPFLATLETGGTVSAEFKIKEFENAWQVTGRFGWREGNLTFQGRDISLKGIHLDLPVWYRTGLAEAPVESLKGKVEVQSVTVPLLPEQPLSILLAAGPNRISVDSPTVIQVPGGDLRLGSVHVKNLFCTDISAHTRLAFDGIKLQSLLSGIGMLPLEGALTGILDPVRYEKHMVTSQGKIEVEVFGGKLFLSDLGASGIFTSAPVFTLNAHWGDLLLTEMTTNTTFGKIEGVLKGHIRDFEIACGQPQKFDLLLETVEKKGVPQTISIKAVDNIAQIGGGQSPFMGLAGAFASVFEKFPYEKIGIQARLENDMFTINGTIRENGTEYLVKRGGFSGVNIVNQNPDNRISFNDMVKRIKRITQKGGAVVR